MGRRYAGILGALAFLTVVGRGLIDGGGAETTLRIAVTSLFVMAVVGVIVGRLAAWFVEESIRWQVRAELEARVASRVKADAASPRTPSHPRPAAGPSVS